MQPPISPTLLLIAAGILGCSKGDTSATASDSATTATSSAPSGMVGPSSVSPVRGTLAGISDSALTVSSATGDVRIAIAAPLQVYSRMPATLSQVRESSFVGVTSVAQADGSQRATEIHIFPDALRGTGEGSYLMAHQGGTPAATRNTMTNGTVTGSAMMTNGSATSPRMTNGTISGRPGGTLVVHYQGGSQTITVPADVAVTTIAPTRSRLTPGANVVVLATKQSDGTLRTSAVMLIGASGSGK